MIKLVLVLFLGFSSLFAFEELTADNFDQKIANKNVIIDFYAVWWGSCKVLERNMTKYNTSKPDNVEIYKINIEKEPALTQKYKAFAVPMLVYIKNGEVLAKERGVKTVEQITKSVNKYFK